MDNDFKIFEESECSTVIEHLIDNPFKPLPSKQYLPNGLPSINKSSNAVCFCCFATDVPLTHAKKCSHKEFVNIYLSMVPSIPLLICNLCHHMLKKIEAFKLQIQNNFRNLVSKKEPNDRCIFINDLSRKPTISIVSLKPIIATSLDPLSVPTVHSEDDHHESFVDDYLGSSGICCERPPIKTEAEETMTTIIPENTTDTKNIPQEKTHYYIELTPTNIKQEMLPPKPPSTHKHPHILQKKHSKSTLANNSDSILLDLLKYDTKIEEVLSMTSKTPSLCPEPMKQTIEKGTNNYLVNLLNSANKPLNLQQKYKMEKTVDKSKNTDNEKVKDESSSTMIPNVDLDECYGGKIDMITLTEAKLLKEREKERHEESFIKNKYKCESCIECFQYEVEFNTHNKRYHTKKDYPMECIFCKKRYLSHNTLDRHVEKHLVRYFCLVCNKRSDNLPALTEHYNETHTDKEPIQKKFECKECDYVTYYKVRLSNHRHRMHKVYICKICNQKLNGYGSHKYHMKYVHDEDKEVFKEKGFYKCDECPASYTHFGSLKSHKKTRHVGEGRPTPVYCQPCDKFLSSKFTYNEHLRHSAAHKHENNYLKFECDDCHDKFPVKRSLKLHIERQHLNIFNHKCHICNKLCVHDQALANHIKTVHEKKKPPKTDVCHVCGKVYSSKEVLKKHMRIHTGERPHACDLCGMTFAQSSTLHTHKKLKHKIPRKNEVLKEDCVPSSSWGI